MTANLRYVLSIFIIFIALNVSGQANYWKKVTVAEKSQQKIRLNKGNNDVQKFRLESALFLKTLPKTATDANETVKMYFPDNQGQLLLFNVKETSVLSADLSKKYPGIKSYSGFGIANKNLKIKFSLAADGIQATMRKSDSGTLIFIQKQKENTSDYVVYTAASKLNKDEFLCETKEEIFGKKSFSALSFSDQKLRKFKIAISASGEYTAYHGGTIVGALSAINATLTRVNEVFENELAITLELVADNDKVIYTDAATDPYTGSFSSEVQTAIATEIGASNYDIGHLFHRTTGTNEGNAGCVGCVCVNGQKGSGYTAHNNPEGEAFDIDFVIHELGHQFGANHTWSYENEGTGVQVEPGSGSTIMGYAGITGANNVQGRSDAYFNHKSLVQISEYISTTSCATEITLVNTAPVITGVGSYFIPVETAFMLDGVATDGDGDALSYCWEQIDDGVVTNVNFGPERISGASFRSLAPTTETKRYFPKLARVVAGVLTEENPIINSDWETLSTVGRDYNFAFTVRDNNSAGGQTVSELSRVTVVQQSTPFKVTSQQIETTLVAGNRATVTWDVGATNEAPINTSMTDILLSIDGGITFPIVLGQDIINDGSHDVLIPGGIATTTAKLMVMASDNVFYAINDGEITIEESEVVLNFSELSFEACQGVDKLISFQYDTYLGFSEESTFSISGMPVNLVANFSPVSTMVDGTNIDITFSNTANVALGDYTITVIATSASVTKSIAIDFSVQDATFATVPLLLPVDGGTDVFFSTSLQWEEVSGVTNYDIEVATDIGFSSIVFSGNSIINSYDIDGLADNTIYFWRVKPKNACGEGVFGIARSFTTATNNCIDANGVALPKEIAVTGTPTVEVRTTVLDDLLLSDIDVNVAITHSFLGDLTIWLESPSGTKVLLVAGTCSYGKNIGATFDDSGATIVCGGTPNISGTVKPVSALSAFYGEPTKGVWKLIISDSASQDGGSVTGFSLAICGGGTLSLDSDNDGVPDAIDNCPGTPVDVFVDVQGCQIYKLEASNFLVKAIDEICSSSNNGSIEITSEKGELLNELTITDGVVVINDSFGASYKSTALEAGNYTVCITAKDGAITYEERCFEVVIDEPPALNVSARVNKEQLSLGLSGGEMYNVALNGIITQTDAAKLELKLSPGYNSLRVTTAKECQGVYVKELFFIDAPIVYSNTSSKTVTIALPEKDEQLQIKLYTLGGKFVNEIKNIDTSGIESIIDISRLSTGVYLMQVKGKTVDATYKVVKL